MELSDRLRKVRKDLGLSQLDFAKSIGLKQGSYSGLETGAKKALSNAVKELLVLQYGVSIDWLESGEGNMYMSGKSDLLSSPPPVYGLEPSAKDKRIAELEELVSIQRELLEFYKAKIKDGE